MNFDQLAGSVKDRAGSIGKGTYHIYA